MVVVGVQTFKNFCRLSWQRKERKPQYGPSMVVGVVPAFTNFVVYLGKRKERKGEYGCGITCIQNRELKASGNQSTCYLGYPIIISHIVWEWSLWCLTRAAVSVAKWPSGVATLSRRLFSFLFVSSPLMEIMVLCCVSFIFTSCEDLKVDIFLLIYIYIYFILL